MAIVYEDRPTGRRAMSAFKCLADHLETDFRLSNKLWSFDLLRTPKFREAAARDTADADMIILSAHGKGDLPDEIKSWVRFCLQHKKCDDGALVALVDSREGADEQSPALSYLEEMAGRAGMDFFSHGVAKPEPRPSPRFEFPESPIEQNNIRTSAPPENRPHWI